MGNIVLIGYQGVGKTTFGKRLAQHLGWDFVDTDEEMERRDQNGRTNKQIFLEDGEEQFRLFEQRVFEDYILKESIVIATGGGMVAVPKAENLFSQFDRVIYLYSEFDVLKPRWVKNQIFLGGKTPREKFDERDRLYRKYCTEIVEGSWDQILLASSLP